MSTPLRLLLADLLDDPTVRSAFDADPEAFLADHGWDGLDGADVHAALGALTHELPLDQAARLAPLVAEESAFDGGGLSAAIAGLQAATAAVAGPVVANGAAADDDIPVALTDDPAAGIDAGSEAGPQPDRDPGSPDVEEDEPEADPSAGIDALRFGDAPVSAYADQGGADVASADEEAAGDPPEGVGAGEAAPVELIAADPAPSFDDHSSRDFYDPREETSELDDTEEPDDGFPY